MKTNRLISLFIALLSALSTPSLLYAGVDSPMKITFEDLRGEVEDHDDPFKDLTQSQFYYLSVYAQVSEMQLEVPEKVSQALKEEMQIAKTALIEDGIDIKEMLEKSKVVTEIYRKAEFSTNPLLSDKTVELSGYMVVLEFDNDKVSEFLLVASIGACSHQSSPPANQVLWVTTKTPIESNIVYQAVTVKGKLQLSTQQKDFYLVDGEQRIDMAYSIENATVTAYQ